MAESVIEIRNLTLSIWDKIILDNVNMEIEKGKITSIVGESGSGKSTTVSAILGILPKGTLVSEESRVEFNGKNIFSIYQDPMNSFNPSIKVGTQLYNMAEGYVDISKEDFYKQIEEIMIRIRLRNPKEILDKYPFELSGGMLQRLMIATAIFVKPDLIIADEPTTALDVSVQKEIIREFRAINAEYGMSIIVVTHDFGVVAELADQVVIMQKGKVKETGDVFTIFDNPKEDYTKRLLKASFRFEKEDKL